MLLLERRTTVSAPVHQMAMPWQWSTNPSTRAGDAGATRAAKAKVVDKDPEDPEVGTVLGGETAAEAGTVGGTALQVDVEVNTDGGGTV